MNEDMVMKTPQHMTYIQSDGDACEMLTISWTQAISQSTRMRYSGFFLLTTNTIKVTKKIIDATNEYAQTCFFIYTKELCCFSIAEKL